jgi:hypothetical protein
MHAGAFSGTGFAKKSSGTAVRAEAEQAHRADVIKIQIAGSYSECAAKEIPWTPKEHSEDIV